MMIHHCKTPDAADAMMTESGAEPAVPQQLWQCTRSTPAVEATQHWQSRQETRAISTALTRALCNTRPMFQMPWLLLKPDCLCTPATQAALTNKTAATSTAPCNAPCTKSIAAPCKTQFLSPAALPAMAVHCHGWLHCLLLQVPLCQTTQHAPTTHAEALRQLCWVPAALPAVAAAIALHINCTAKQRHCLLHTHSCSNSPFPNLRTKDAQLQNRADTDSHN